MEPFPKWLSKIQRRFNEVPDSTDFVPERSEAASVFPFSLVAAGSHRRTAKKTPFFFTLVTGPRRSLSLKLSSTRVYEPQIRAKKKVARNGTEHQRARGTYKTVKA